MATINPSLVPTTWGLLSGPNFPFSIISTYLQNSSSPEGTAEKLAAQINTDGTLPPGIDAPSWVYNIFNVTITIATQIPHDHPWQQRLASLLNVLKDQPPPPSPICKEIVVSLHIPSREFRWEDFPSFGQQQHELYDYKNRYDLVIRENASFDCWSPEQWRNINQFLALLVRQNTVSGYLLETFVRSGLLVLKNTLEISRDADHLEDNIPSAAVWLMTAGKWFYENRGLVLPSCRELDEGEVLLYQGEDVLSDERWRFWEGRFSELAGRGDLSEEAREWASKAVAFMPQ